MCGNICPANVLFFTEQLSILTKAAIKIIQEYNFKKEIEAETNINLWMLNQYQTYCGWCKHRTPWDYFPRHLSKKEFLDPYMALEKFTNYHTPRQWKKIIDNIRYYALSYESIFEILDKPNFIGTWLHLHKLLDATHLIEVRQTDPQTKPRPKWQPSVENNNHSHKSTHD